MDSFGKHTDYLYFCQKKTLIERIEYGIKNKEEAIAVLRHMIQRKKWIEKQVKE